jgi:uncharacterized coiled-coil protein SlyX
MPDPETVDFEREFGDIVRELRAIPSEAPPQLRERVRALGEPAPRRRPRISRRAVLVLAPACVVALAAGAVLYSVVTPSSTHRESFARVPGNTKTPVFAPAHVRRGVVTVPGDQAQALMNAGAAPAPNPKRYQNYQASLRVRVKDFDALGKQTAAAMQITQVLGGYVASVQQSTTSGAPGEADLVLRVPVSHVQGAMIKLSALGTVVEQHVSIEDLNAVVAAQRQQILQLKIEIARITAVLQQSLPADVRLRLEFQLEEAKRSLASVSGANRSTLGAAAMSRIALALTSEQPAAAKHHRGLLGRSTHAAISFLAGAGAITLAALIVLAPLLVLALLFLLGLRAYRRREEQRLLATTHP